MVISFSKKYAGRKEYPLSKLMIAGLLVACEKQRDGNLFGQKDIPSFIPLVSRGLLVTRYASVNGKAELIWAVTDQAIEALQKLQIEIVA
jgi:hypothetical protein